MNTNAKRSDGTRAGFTLVELLVVILIIAVLLSLIFPAIGALRRAAMIRKAAAHGTQIANALKDYRTVYGKWPAQIQGTQDNTYDTDVEQVPIITALTNNPRGTAFLEIPEGVMSNGCYLDPWRVPFVIAMDENGDGNVTINATITSPSDSLGPLSLSNQTAAVLSWGKNPGSPQNRRICSWEL